ncbi:MAG: hypothetical protein IKW89_06190 [Bacteroidales bacterium]|nr:hypothetical protein [Bacteroidales bacterium]
MSDALDLIQPHWVEEYHLRDYEYEVLSLPAAELLTPLRFDLFAKLYYIRNRKVRPRLARKVYYENIRALVPLGKEWGQEQVKSSFAAHFKAFDALIDSFETSDFKPDVSIVPIGKDHVLLDGAHRVSTLAYYGKSVTVSYFPGVEGECYPYTFFLGHGMSRRAADLVALEGIRYIEGMNALLLRPGEDEPDLGGAKVFYHRIIKLAWNCYYKYVFFVPEAGWQPPKDAYVTFFTDKESVKRVSELVLTWKGRRRCYKGGSLSFFVSRILESLDGRLKAEGNYLELRSYFEKETLFRRITRNSIKMIRRLKKK